MSLRGISSTIGSVVGGRAETGGDLLARRQQSRLTSNLDGHPAKYATVAVKLGGLLNRMLVFQEFAKDLFGSLTAVEFFGVLVL